MLSNNDICNFFEPVFMMIIITTTINNNDNDNIQVVSLYS